MAIGNMANYQKARLVPLDGTSFITSTCLVNAFKVSSPCFQFAPPSDNSPDNFGIRMHAVDFRTLL